jgi:1-acyl-sn-glycerol-3-phosphate acyltransferase
MPTASASQGQFKRGFGAFFATQFFGAFNDNLFKNAVVIWTSAAKLSAFGLKPAVTISVISGLFIVPFFLMSATAGQLADRHDRARLLRALKLAELAIMALAALGFVLQSLPLLLGCVFLMGAQSAFVGPIKYSALPELSTSDGLVRANALMEMGTFLAILFGTIAGGVVILLDAGPLLSAGGVLAFAALGYLTSRAVPALPSADPTLRVDWNPWRPTRDILRITAREEAVFLSVMGISWFWFLGAAFLSLLPSYVTDTLGAHEHVVTLLLCVFCIGIALGSMLCESLSGKNLELGLVPLGSIGMTLFTLDLFWIGRPYPPGETLGVAAFLAAPGSFRVLTDLFGVAVFGGFYTVPLYTLIQQRSTPATRARVIAGNNILNALFMAASSVLLAALFAGQVPVPLVFLVLAVLNAVVAVYIYGLLPEFLLRFVAWVLSRTLYRLEVRGHERIPETGAAVIVCNHVSFVDFAIVAGAVRRPVRFVMDHRIAQTPGVSALFRQAKAIPIAPAREDQALMQRAFERMAEELKNGEVVCIFPEGKITKTGELAEFKAGIERIIAETPVPVVPMALHGLWGSVFSRKGGPALRKLPRRFRARLVLQVGEAVPASEVSAAGLQATVAELLEQAGA